MTSASASFLRAMTKPELVMVVTMMQHPGRRAFSSFIIGWSDRRSPALAPCSQMRGEPRPRANERR
jgi:hypothetical protein